jgi:hypothetical protein
MDYIPKSNEQSFEIPEGQTVLIDSQLVSRHESVAPQQA